MNKKEATIIIYHSGNKLFYDLLSIAIMYVKYNINVIFYSPTIRDVFHDSLDENRIPYYGLIEKNNKIQLREFS